MQAVKDAYRSKMKDYHPDKVATMPIEFRQLAEAKSKDINAAYDFIVSKM
jgi:DnaJ like chaperone protein